MTGPRSLVTIGDTVAAGHGDTVDELSARPWTNWLTDGQPVAPGR